MNDSNGTPRQSLADRFDTVLLCLLILAMCSQFNLRAVGQNTLAQGFATKQLFIALSDVVLLLVFTWFVARTTVMRAWRRLWWPPAACWALFAALIIAALHSQPIVTSVADSLADARGPKAIVKALITPASKEAIAEIIQFTAYFVIAPFLFVNLLHDRRKGVLIERLRCALETFAAAVLITTGVALWQMRAGLESPPPTAFFGSANIYSGFLAMALPLLVAHALHAGRKRLPVTVIACIALWLGLLTMTSLWAVIAVFLGVLIAGCLLRVPGRTALVLASMAIVAGCAWFAPMQLAGNWPEFRRAQNAAAAAFQKYEAGIEAVEKARAERDAKGESTALAAMRAAQARLANTLLNRADFLHVNAADEKVKKPYMEWYAAMGWNVPREKAFATGVGPGNYQSNIKTYYSSLPTEGKMPLDSNNLYLVQGVALGVLGLGALIWLLAYFARQAWIAQRRAPDEWLGGGVLACLAAFCFVTLFHALFVRGTGLVLAFILSLAIVAIQRAAQRAAQLAAAQDVINVD
ncbi:MAG TPA: hypothetical protein VNA16_07130 [Abditibacteriaceae bacterium]|nr:hypothetical protein [Abditibacteriaceae bacterium]